MIGNHNNNDNNHCYSLENKYSIPDMGHFSHMHLSHCSVSPIEFDFITAKVLKAT